MDRDWKQLVRARIEPLNVDPARAHDIIDELAQHVAQHHADLVASGMDDEAALAMVLKPLRDHPRVAAEIARADRPRPVTPAAPSSENAGVIGDAMRVTRRVF